MALDGRSKCFLRGKGKVLGDLVTLSLGRQKNFFPSTGEGVEVEMRVEEPIKLRYLMLTFFGAINFSFILFIVGCSFHVKFI